jgi:hypothetical protein
MLQRLIRTKTALAVVLFALSGTIQIISAASTQELSGAEKHGQKNGLLAVSSISGAGSSIIGDISGGEDIFSAVKPPISGSVSKIPGDRWSFMVENNTSDHYKVDIELIQRDLSGSTVKFSSYSYSLRPKSKAQDTVSAGLNARRAELFLRRSSVSSPASPVR